MTAEIALMNKKAVALAADSAVTINNGERKYNSENKLFMLSKYHPVGIMIYDSVEFMGIPWETIIKSYRNHLGRTEFNTLEEYGEDFLQYLKKDELNFQFSERDFYCILVINYIVSLSNQCNNKLKNRSKELNRELSSLERTNIIDALIDEEFNMFETHFKRIDDIDEDCDEYIKTTYGNVVSEVLNNEAYNTIKYNEAQIKKLETLAVNLFVKDCFSILISGIVITGFGKKDVFPSLISYHINGVINGYLKYKVDKQDKVNLDKDYVIEPFAQDDVIKTFLKGIDDNYYRIIEDEHKDLLLNITEYLKTINLLEDQIDKVKNIFDCSLNKLGEKINNYINNEYIVPIVKTIRSLPKDELASMAEALVNLTSFKRNVSTDINTGTVGGEIDVAIISKGDGFVWIKRKHYFKPELNNHFFQNYFNDESK